MQYSESQKKEILIQLAKRVKQLRKENNITQEDAYNDTGINFARIERAKRNIEFITLHRICDYFKITFEDFFSEF